MSAEAGTRDDVVPALVAGFVAVLVGITSSVALVFAAARQLGADAATTASWIAALGVGMGVTSIVLSWRYRQPVLIAWSTPGAALIAGTSGLSLPEATGAFIVCGVLILLSGLTRVFERIMDRVPQSLAAALLAGVLARFGLDAVGAVSQGPLLVIAMTAAYLVARRAWPRYAVPVVLLAGMAVAAAQGLLDLSQLHWAWVKPVWTDPVFSLRATVGLALPLFLVTMASQNLPGVAAQRAAGYDVPVSPVIASTGLATVLLAPFGGYALNLAAITAAICMGREAGADPTRRWRASAAAGVFYLGMALAAGTVAELLLVFPRPLVLAVAGLALLGTVSQGLALAMRDEAQRDAAILTFLVALSGVGAFGIGSAFWAMLAGALAWLVQQYRPGTGAGPGGLR